MHLIIRILIHFIPCIEFHVALMQAKRCRSWLGGLVRGQTAERNLSSRDSELLKLKVDTYLLQNLFCTLYLKKRTPFTHFDTDYIVFVCTYMGDA